VKKARLDGNNTVASIKTNCPDPKPTLPFEFEKFEKDLHDFIVEMQRIGYPLSRRCIISKATPT
jgi:hypothetical protein